MFPLRLVFDTNVVISAALKPRSLQRTALLLALKRPMRLYVSAPILQEYADVLRRPELGIPRGLRLQTIQWIVQSSRMVEPQERLEVCTDPDDNMFVECASAGRADYLVTGNARHFPAYWRSTKIISTRTFLELVAPELLR